MRAFNKALNNIFEILDKDEIKLILSDIESIINDNDLNDEDKEYPNFLSRE